MNLDWHIDIRFTFVHFRIDSSVSECQYVVAAVGLEPTTFCL